ncbi:hypothetical protein GPECTOR_21g716 [Gonium pectorale]|uniref:TPPC8 first Ig-like domain-containing protein n=1 Tax=Gonium pectorale TaxID=33097 RepID=A0A150GJ67_GONPE|nr:hypothetical protein GPECTOR_21g716 [Gonium pectorale]|eukprot:KXZ49490.1 hypothetical protein GPECTOR_21g716 [Gonium pectorale]
MVIEGHLQEVLKASAQRHAKLDPSPELLQRLMSDKPPDMRELTPWFDEYRSEFLRLLRFGDHETLDHPVACVYVIPADVTNPASHFDTLLGQLLLPPLMQQDVMYTVRDRDFPRHYVLLLDAAAGMSEKRAQDNLIAIRKLYGEAHCSLLRINSGNGGGAGEPLARPPGPPGGVGAFLTVQDLDAVGAFVREFVSRTLLPRLEERMARLNTSITAARRGLRNRLNRFWKGSAEDRTTDRPYPWHSVEGQMRQLGDLAFLLRQYAFAESTYRLAAQDYLAENNFKWYAGVEEMIGLCGVLGEPADPIAAVLLQNDPMKYFMRAYENYIKPPAAAIAAAAASMAGAGGAPPGNGGAPQVAAAGQASGAPPGILAASKVGRMLATRVVLLGAAVQSAAGRHRATSDALMRAQSEEENARAGLLLEQSAYAMLFARPPLVRKFAFQMVLAGIRYICCGQKRIAIHAYRQVLSLYLGRKWKHIEEHLHAVLGAQCVEYGDKERALWHYCALLDCGHRPPAQQANNVTQFLNLLAGVRDQLAITNGGVSLVDSLPLPLVNRYDVRVLCSDSACYAGPAARTVADSTWLRMEAVCTSGSNNWLVEGGGFKQEKDHEEYTMCVAGEEVGVQVEFRNPLAVKLKVTNVQLICTFTAEGDAAAARAQAADAAAAGSATASSSSVAADGLHPLLPGGAPAAISAQPRSEFIHVPEAQFTLHPGEALVEVLRVLPRAPGWLRVTGVTWTLNGVAHGRIAFDVKGRRRKKPKGTRRLLFQVVPTMPRLELLADPLPPALYSGELCRVIMRVRNVGGLPLRALSLVVGHPEAVCPATDANKDRPLLESLTDPRETVQLSKITLASQRHLQLYRLWPGRELAPGQVLEWPLWLHPRGVGTLKLPLVWYGEPSAPKCGMRHRTLRVCGSIAVQPLLAARPFVWPSPTHLSHCQLRLAIDNSKDGERVVLQQVAAVTVPPTSQQHGHPGTSGSVTPAGHPSTPTARGPPAGWRIAVLGGGLGSSAPVADAQLPGGGHGGPAAESGSGPAAPPLTRSLPLAVPLHPGESASLSLELIAPPPVQRPAGSGASAAGGPPHAGGPGAGPSPPPSGMATPGRHDEPGMANAAMAVAQAAEAVRSLALGDGGLGASAAGPSGRLPYVDGADPGLQRLNLFGPGVLAHFYRRGRKGMVTAPTTGGAAGGPPGPTLAGTPAPLPVRGPGVPIGGPGAPPGGSLAVPQPGMGPQPPALGPSPSFGPGQAVAGPHGAAAFQPGQAPHGGPPPSLSRGTSFAGHAAAAPGPGSAAGVQAGPTGGVPGGSGRPPTPGPAGPPAASPQPGGSGPGRPALPLADPPLDLLLLWHVVASQRTGPHQGQQRLGLCRPYDTQAGRDLSGCLQAHMAPIRMLLTGPNGASSAAGPAGPVIRHDFRRSSLAVVPLRLVVRNNTALEARLQVEVGDGWQASDAPHSWQASTAVLGQGAAGGGGGPQAPGFGQASLHGAGAFAAGPTGGSGAGAGRLPPCSEYVWVGPSSVAVPRLEPGGEVEVPLAVSVFRPGAYCVTGYRCTAFIESSGAVETQRGEPLCFRIEG